MSRTIRRAVPGDAGALFPLVQKFEGPAAPEEPDFRERLLRLIGRDDAQALVADGPEGLIGYLLGHDPLIADGPVARVEELYVDPDRRHDGVGRELLDAFEQWARSRRRRGIELTTRAAMGFYERLGYGKSSDDHLHKRL